MSKHRGLGRGLDALIPSEGAPGGASKLPVGSIARNPRQPRQRLDSAELRELAESIRTHGVLQPLVVTPIEAGDGYVLIAGERRLEAARLAGLKTVPAIVRRATEQQRLELALVENLQRTDLGALEAAEGYRQLIDEFGLSHQQVAEQVGKSRAAVSNTLRLLKLAPEVQAALAGGKISEGHARALLALSSAPAQAAVLKTVIRRELNVRQTEELVRKMGGERHRPAPKRARSADERDLEERLRRSLGTRVSLRRGRRGGSLVIHFYSDEELNALVDRLLEGG